MLRRLSSAVATVMVVMGLGAAAPAPTAVASTVSAEQQVTPQGGTYSGRDSRQQHVSFTYDPRTSQILHFRVVGSLGTGVVEHTDVTDGRTAVSCTQHEHGHVPRRCFQLHWTGDEEVTGAWGSTRAQTIAFTVERQTPPHPALGHYVGYTVLGATSGVGMHPREMIWLRHDPRGVTGFGFPRWGEGGSTNRTMPVSESGHFEGCGDDGLCVRGHWQTNTFVVGVWKNESRSHPHWRPWEVHFDSP